MGARGGCSGPAGAKARFLRRKASGGPRRQVSGGRGGHRDPPEVITMHRPDNGRPGGRESGARTRNASSVAAGMTGATRR